MPADSDEYLSALAECPRRISALSRGAGAAKLRARTAAEPWSPNDVLAHLHACADVWARGCSGC